MSALCSLEHFGLGRYGDPVDPEACFKCFENIQRKLKKGGRLYQHLDNFILYIRVFIAYFMCLHFPDAMVE